MSNAGAPSGPARDLKVDLLVEWSGASPVSSAQIPVTIREPSTRMVAKGFTGQKLSVAPGKYFVVAQLPDGATHVEQVQIAEQTAVIHLKQSDETEASSIVPRAAAGELHGTLPPAGPQLEVPQDSISLPPLTELAPLANAPGEDTSAQFARRYRAVRSSLQPFAFDKVKFRSAGQIVELSSKGEILKRDTTVEMRYEDNSLGSVKVSGANRAGHFVLLQKGLVSKTTDVAVAIPADASSQVEFIIPEEQDRLLIAILDNKSANALLSYLVQQSYEKVAAYSEDIEAKFRTLLRAKMTDPIGAVIGGYGLLSLNKLSPLDQWSQNLPVAAPWLPDSYAIHGETHARLGKHDIAARAFYELSKCGIPIFSPGLSYAESRVRLYAGHELPDGPAAKEMAAWLDSLCDNVIKRLKIGEVLTTIVGPKSAN